LFQFCRNTRAKPSPISLGTVRKFQLAKKAEADSTQRVLEDEALINRVFDEINKKYILVPRDATVPSAYQE
jgi:hypothetical protein